LNYPPDLDPINATTMNMVFLLHYRKL